MKIKLLVGYVFIFFISGCSTPAPPEVVYVPVPKVEYRYKEVPTGKCTETHDACNICLQRYNIDLKECDEFASAGSTVEVQDEVVSGCLRNKGWSSANKPCAQQCGD